MFNSDFLVLEFGYCNIKLIVATTDSKGIKVKRMDLIPTIEHSISNGRINNLDRVVEQINKHLTTNNINAKKTILTITSPSIVMREVVVRNYKKAVIKSFINIEADSYFPLDLSTCVVDYKILPPKLNKADEKESRVLLVAIPAEIINEYLAVIRLLGLNIDAIDIASDSVTKLYFRRKQPQIEHKEHKTKEIVSIPSVSTAFVDIGAEMTNVTIATNNIMKYNKIIHFGSLNFNNALAHDSAQTFEEIENEKRNTDLSLSYFQNDPQGTEKLLKNAAITLLEDLSVFFDFHNSRETGNKISNIVLVGGGAYQKGIIKIFEDAFGLPISCGFKFDGVQFNHSISNIDEKLLYFYKCIGATIKL